MTLKFAQAAFAAISSRSRARRATLVFLPALLLACVSSTILAQSSTTVVSATTSFGFITGSTSASYTTGPNGCQNPQDPSNIGSIQISFPNGSCYSGVGLPLNIPSCSSLTFVTPGAYQAFGVYSGFNGLDNNGNTCSIPGSSASMNITVPQAASTMQVQGPSGPLQSGQILTLPISVTGASFAGFSGPSPTGSVSLYYGNEALTSQQLSSGLSTEISTATISVPTKGIAPGQYQLQVKYPGDVNYIASASPTFTVTIEKAQLSTGTALIVSPNPIVAGETATLGITITPTGNVAPSGTVKILANGALVDTAAVTNGSATVVAPTTGLAPGNYSVIALYSGDAFNLPSTSAPVSVTFVAQTPTTTTVTVTPNSLVEGQTTQITATVQQQIGNVVPTGTVALTANGSLVATLPLTNGTATLAASTAGIAPGSYTVIGKYSGSSIAETSTSPGVAVTILKPATVNLIASPNPVKQGNVTTLIAGVVDGNGNPVTSGTVNFSYAGSALGSANIGSGATAQLPIATGGFAVGTYVISATYTGSQTIPPATGTVSLVVQ